MTNEEALRLAKLAWPDVARIKIHQRNGRWLVQSVMSLDFGIRLEHPNRARFEAALRVLAGET